MSIFEKTEFSVKSGEPNADDLNTENDVQDIIEEVLDEIPTK